jgi:hypothetical protein
VHSRFLAVSPSFDAASDGKRGRIPVLLNWNLTPPVPPVARAEIGLDRVSAP